jgi:hypothetical protein
LRAQLDADGASAVVWGEALSADHELEGIVARDRRALRPAETLVIWTAPPDVDEWEEALAAVAPQEVILVCLDPGLDAPRAFLRRLAALVNYALREYRGQTELAALAAATAQTEWVVYLGLQWLAARGQISFEVEGSRVALRSSGRRAGTEDREQIEGRLQAELQETAAFRAYLRTANADRLVNESALDGE